MAAIFEKLEQIGLKERFVREIQKKIFAGELLPGEQLAPERELAAQMGISRSLVNMGMLDLESKGFVKVEPRRGAFISDYKKNPTPQTLAALMSYDSTKLDHALFQSLMDTRRLVERECARLSVERGDTAAYAGMREALGRMSTPAQSAQVDALFDYHYLLTQSSGNIVYPMIFKGFETALRRLMELRLQLQPRQEEYIRLHENLLRALENGDRDGADEAIMLIMDVGIGDLEKTYA